MIIILFIKVLWHHPKMLPVSCLMLMWNWNLMGDTKVEEVATAFLVSLIFEILHSRINFSDGRKRGRTQNFPQQ